MSYLKSSIFTVLALLTLLLIPGLTQAAASFGVDTPITMTGLSNIEMTVLANSEAETVAVSPTFISVNVGIGSRFIIRGPSNYTLQNSAGYDETCGGGRVLTLTATSEPISTVITPILTTAPCVDATTTQSSQGGSSGSSGGGGSVISATPTATPTATQAPTAEGPAAGGDAPAQEVKKLDKPDAKRAVGGFFDISDLPNSDITRILSLVQLMQKEKTFVAPNHHLFSPSSITTAGFTAQIFTAIDGKGCNSNEYPGVAGCLEVAIERGYLPAGLNIKSRVSRFLFYEGLLKARKISYENEQVSVDSFKKVCKDYGGSSERVAQIYMTAKKAGLTSSYFMKKCQLDLNFSRQEAVRFAFRGIKK